jgi:hypothetical protein
MLEEEFSGIDTAFRVGRLVASQRIDVTDQSDHC